MENSDRTLSIFRAGLDVSEGTAYRSPIKSDGSHARMRNDFEFDPGLIPAISQEKQSKNADQQHHWPSHGLLCRFF
jgi:hypothetical protein